MVRWGSHIREIDGNGTMEQWDAEHNIIGKWVSGQDFGGGEGKRCEGGVGSHSD
jgi:hypothetical protein